MAGQVVTFYSYKGGVGRSFLLANVAAVLAEWGYRVLCIDWDLEAPGLNYYFSQWVDRPTSRGLLAIIEGFARGQKPSWRRYVTPVRAPRAGGRLHLLPAGQKDARYVEKIQGVDWAALYEERGFGLFLETMRDQWKRRYDFVLIDSRTGISDIGGICTVQLPDTLVFVFTANEQSVEGACDVARRSTESRSALPFERSRLMTVPVLSRYEQRVEFKIAAKWERRISSHLVPFYRPWLPARTSADELMKLTRIPYVAYWTFGEQLPVITDRLRNDDPEAVNYSMLNIAALLANGLDEANHLMSSRDSYLTRSRKRSRRPPTSSRKPGPLIFISHAFGSKTFVERLARELKKRRFRVAESSEFESGGRMRDLLLDRLSEATAFVTVVDRGLASSSLEELDYYLSLSIRESETNRVIPVIRSDAALRRLPKVLLSLPLIDARSRRVEAVASKIAEQIELVASEKRGARELALV